MFALTTLVPQPDINHSSKMPKALARNPKPQALNPKCGTQPSYELGRPTAGIPTAASLLALLAVLEGSGEQQFRCIYIYIYIYNIK